VSVNTRTHIVSVRVGRSTTTRYRPSHLPHSRKGFERRHISILLIKPLLYYAHCCLPISVILEPALLTREPLLVSIRSFCVLTLRPWASLTGVLRINIV